MIAESNHLQFNDPISKIYQSYLNSSIRIGVHYCLLIKKILINFRENNLKIYINILDVNDNPPIFSKNIYNLTINKNSINQLILNIKATDMDKNLNGLIKYYLINNEFDEFYLDELSGNLFLKVIFIKVHI